MRRKMVLAALSIVMLAPVAHGVETNVTVRAFSRDAKVMGSKVGGARITIRESRTGKLLAKGIQTGGTGDTTKIMIDPHPRGGDVYAAKESGSFVARLDLVEPTWVDITAEGPIDYPQSTARASKSLLLVPGKHIYGEGVLLEIHGFNIELVAPASTSPAGEPITVRTKLTMT